MPSTRVLILAILLLLVLQVRARAEGFPGLDSFPDPSSLISDDVSNTFVEVIGLGTDHRPYTPATTLGAKPGLSLGIELTLAKIPPSFNQLLEQLGVGGDSAQIPVLPVPRIHVHKGLGNRAEVGFSWVRYKNIRVTGADFKIAVHRPEEGPTVAIRVNHTWTTIEFISTRTLTPQILVSRALSFADPYLGVGYQMASGKIEITLPELTPEFPELSPDLKITKEGKARSLSAFTGVAFNIVGFELVLEMSYSQRGAHTLGTKVGLAF